ncbi:MAG: hypothetical protein EOO73_00960 [Myxococcales bacterium]|nr:MAG: hypothetical protein EOO73_00960 [Myxococcales bacterium]
MLPAAAPPAEAVPAAPPPVAAPLALPPTLVDPLAPLGAGEDGSLSPQADVVRQTPPQADAVSAKNSGRKYETRNAGVDIEQ